MSVVLDAVEKPAIDPTDRRIIAATQTGLPLTPDPYGDVAVSLGLPRAEVLTRMRRMQALGIIRRIGVIPNHYALGYRANGMSVWDVADDQAQALGRMIGALDFVSHCYRRPRHLPLWPYNLFAMVHGRDRAEVEAMVAEIAQRLGVHCRAHAVLYSRRILKKAGLRIEAS